MRSAYHVFPLTILALFVAFSPTAFAAETFVMGELGRGNIEFDEGSVVSEFSIDDDDALQLAVTSGYIFDFGAVLAGSFSFSSASAGTNSFFNVDDDYETYDLSLLVGYSFELGKHFRIVPMVGLSFWEFDARESPFLNPGPEESIEKHGTDVLWKLNLEVPVSRLVHLNFSYSYQDYEFFDVDSLRFGVKFVFH